MRLERPTHVQKSNRSSGWMSEFTEEIPGQIAAIVNRLGDGEYTFTSIYPLPPDAKYDETVYPDEWIQATGTAPERITAEIRRLDPDGMYRVYTVGHAEAAGESAATEPIHNGDNTYTVRPAEVLAADEVIDLFQHYYDQHAVPSGWHLREQPEFATPADAGTPPTDKPAAGVKKGTQATSPATAKSQGAAANKAEPDKPKGRQQTGGN
jgi:hypothetical protein